MPLVSLRGAKGGSTEGGAREEAPRYHGMGEQVQEVDGEHDGERDDDEDATDARQDGERDDDGDATKANNDEARPDIQARLRRSPRSL